MVVSTFSVDALPQADGRFRVTERHVTPDGEVIIPWLAEPGTNIDAVVEAHRLNIEEGLSLG